jgi:polyhydroxyalkanoate synthesis repressor PhaR
MAENTVVIKKYGNRRLYDTSASRYVNLDDIAGLVRNGNDVQVVDAKTGEDLTRVVLTQIILEDAKGQPSGLPLEMLRQMIVATDRAGRDFIMSYLKSAFEAYQRVHDTVQTRLSEVSPLQMVRNFIQREPDGEMEKLRRRLAELEAKMETGAVSRPKTGKRQVPRRKRPSKRR